MGKIVVAGGGAAGMIAAVCAARAGHHVTIIEKNEKLGKKLFITGKGRCNLTNSCETEELFHNIISGKKFLYSAFYSFDSRACMEFFEKLGLRLKTERGERVFPASDHSSDVLKVLQKELQRLSVEILLNTPVKSLIIEENPEKKAVGVRTRDGKAIMAEKVLLATGGLSYPLTGSTGDGHKMAEQVGHSITPMYPALVPLYAGESWCRDLMGLSLKNVAIAICDGKKQLYSGFGEMLFTHFGVSGPLVLSGSSYVTKTLAEKQLDLYIDLKPALTGEQLDKRVLRDFEENKNKSFKNAVTGLFPGKLLPVMLLLSKIDAEKKVHEITKEERKYFVHLIKNLRLTLIGTGDYKEAIITQGGVSLKEINPSDMQSKLIKNLYFAGEILDIDALTGGFNLQVAWSCGHLAGTGM